MDLYQPPDGFGLQATPTQQPPPLKAGSLQDLNTNLTFSLINNTRIMLPIRACYTVMESPSNETRRESLYACSVDWNRVELVQNVLNQNGVSMRNHRTFMNQINLKSHDWTSNDITHDLLRYSYLSINSFLAVCGFLVNLFIILILLFNLRQRRRSTGSNMASKNNLLLFQLTITGLLLGAYILIDNMNMCIQICHYVGLDASLHCHEPLLALPVPLLTFLPRTYFHWKTQVNDNSISETSSSPVIILRYLANISLFEINEEVSQSSRYMDIKLPWDNRTKRFDLTSDGLELSTAMLTSHQEEVAHDNSKPSIVNPSPITRRKSLKLMLILGAIPLLINIIASAHIYTLAALAYDRYRAIAHPFQYLKSVHTSRTKTFFVLSWLILLTLNLILPITVNEQDLAHHHEAKLESSSITHWYSWLLECIARIHKLDITASQVDSIQDTTNGYSQYSLASFEESECKTNEAYLAKHLGSLLKGSSKRLNSENANKKLNNEMHVILLIALSFMGLLGLILLPLVIITICNIGIFRIVKVHERRLSFSSNTTVAASNLTLQQQSKQVSPIVQMDLHQQMMMRREISDRAAALNKQVALTRQIIKFEPKNMRSAQTSTLCDPMPPSAVCREVTEVELRRGLGSKEFSVATNKNCKSLTGECYGAVSESGSEKQTRSVNQIRGSCEDISSYDGAFKQVSNNDVNYYGNDPNSKDSFINHESVSTVYRFLRSVSSNSEAHQRFPAGGMRKSSDSGLVMTGIEDSVDGTQQHMSDSDLESPTLSNSPSCLFRERNSSGSILNQLKLAGLSFAGIAIQPRGGPSPRRVMHKSSSTCSFGGFQSNMNWNHRQQSCDHSASSRASYDSSFTGIPTGRSYVSLDSSLKQYDDFSTSKYKTRLLEEPQPIYTTPIQTPSRMTLSFGTKSAIFNILVWLIMTLLLLTLPHYLFCILKPLTSLSFFGGPFAGSHLNYFGVEESFVGSLCRIFELFTGEQTNSRLDLCFKVRNDAYLVNRHVGMLVLDSITVGLACLCRLLFLIIIPLNCCLYGFSSRSFRTTIKMILKRYISKKQASIEINQRHRPLSGLHQRASSCTNVSPMVHECRNDTRSEKGINLKSFKHFFDNWKFIRNLRMKPVNAHGEGLNNPNFAVNINDKSSEVMKNAQRGIMTPQISLDDSYCKSNSLNDTCNLNLLTNSVNSSLCLAHSLVDLQDINYFRGRKDSTRSILLEKRQVLQRHNISKRARAASVSSVGNLIHASKGIRRHSIVRGNNFRSKSVDYYRNNAFLGGYVDGRINKHRLKKTRQVSRSAPEEKGYQIKNVSCLQSTRKIELRAEASRSFWKRIRNGIAGWTSINGKKSNDDKRSGRNSFNDHQPENQCNVALLSSRTSENNRSSTVNFYDNKWFDGVNRMANLTSSPTFVSMNSNISNSMMEARCCATRPPIKHSNEDSNNCHLNSVANPDKNSLYLRPPTFLKLSLDVRGHMNHTYRITSTLSPIRESSSNHSYASSQSSLANNVSKTPNWSHSTQDTPSDHTHLSTDKMRAKH